MKTLLTIVLTTLVAHNGLGCQCVFRDIKTELNLTKEIIAGKLIDSGSDYQKIHVLKTWRGVIKSDTVIIKLSDDGCHRGFLFPLNEFFLIYSDYEGIHNCSRTTRYTSSQDIKVLDSLYHQTMWINEKEINTLSELEFKREYIIKTDEGEINIKGKKVAFNFEGKIKTKEQLPADLNRFYPLRYFLVATKETLIKKNCGIDYIIYVNQVHQDMLLMESKRKRIKNQSVRLTCR